MRKIDWKALWQEFNAWYDRAERRSNSFNCPQWDTQVRKIEKLVEAQLRAKR